AALAQEMLAVMRAGKGIGLAAPQVGISKRLFVVELEGGEPFIFFNPRIVEMSERRVKMEEGCMSLPGIYADVLRPDAVRVHAWNARGRAFTLDADGLLARVIQHEADHLRGIMFIDLLSELKKKRILRVWEERPPARPDTDGADGDAL
ncbi:MAG: peptide deformylase, partial [Spirochaetales bacterium]|nr:peptide deformylase [Spirochaetales bacterium]